MSTYETIWSCGCVYFLKWKFLAMCSHFKWMCKRCLSFVFWFDNQQKSNCNKTTQYVPYACFTRHYLLFVTCIQFAHCTAIGMCSNFRVQNRSDSASWGANSNQIYNDNLKIFYAHSNPNWKRANWNQLNKSAIDCD